MLPGPMELDEDNRKWLLGTVVGVKGARNEEEEGWVSFDVTDGVLTVEFTSDHRLDHKLTYRGRWQLTFLEGSIGFPE